jgi:ribonuclease E
VESVALSVLRILEEDAMKKGVEKVIAHLPIECAAFLLNEKRSVIERIENRLKVGIVILPSRHLETPSYDIEVIRERDHHEEKNSYSQIKAEAISIPDFAQQVKHNSAAVKPAITEFLHDSPAPMQNKNEAAILIKRFWNKLTKSMSSDDIVDDFVPSEGDTDDTSETSAEPVKTSKSKNNRRNKNNRNQKQRGVKPVVANEEATVLPLENTVVNTENAPVESNVEGGNEVAADAETAPRKNNNRNNLRRGPNRRKPRNPDYKKPVSDGDSTDSNSAERQHTEDASSQPTFEAHSSPSLSHPNSDSSDNSSNSD